MISIKELQKNAKKGEGKKALPVGKYHSVVLSVTEPEEYAPGEKLVIKYELTNPEGEKFKFKEEYLLRRASERTYCFMDYLAEYGIREFEDFVGCEEEVDIRLRRGRSKEFPSIIARDMITIPVEDENELHD